MNMLLKWSILFLKCKLLYIHLSLATVPEVAHILSFYSTRSKWSLLSALLAAVSEILGHFQNYHIWAWNLATGKRFRSCTYTLFLPKGSELSLFSLHGQRFPTYGPFFKIAIFGHESWPLTKDPEVAHILPFHPKGVEIRLIFALWGAVLEIWADFQNCHIWAWNLAIGKTSRSCTYTLFLPWSKLRLFSLCRQWFQR